MTISTIDMFALVTAFTAILMIGTTHLRLNIGVFSIQTLVLATITAMYAVYRHETHLWLVAAALVLLKAFGVPKFLSFIIRKVNVQRDSSTFVPASIAMHISIVFLIVSYLLARQLPDAASYSSGWPTATAAISLVCSGLTVMLTRRSALSQIVGFLIMENGIYLFGLTHTRGMPLLIEMGIMLDVLAGVMIAGLIVFRIKKDFEHIDVSKLAELRE